MRITIKPLVFERHPTARMEWQAPIDPFRWHAVVWKYRSSDKWWRWYVEPLAGGGITKKTRTKAAAMKKANAEYQKRVSQLLESQP